LSHVAALGKPYGVLVFQHIGYVASVRADGDEWTLTGYGTDATTVLQASIITGVHTYWGEGTYVTGAPVNIAVSNFHLEAAGRGVTIIDNRSVTATDVGIYVYGTAGVHLNNVTIEHLSVTGTDGNDTGIQMYYVDNSLVYDCRLYNCGEEGMQVDECEYTTINCVWAYNNNLSDSDSADFELSNSRYCTFNVCKSNGNAVSEHGFLLRSETSDTYSNNFVGCTVTNVDNTGFRVDRVSLDIFCCTFTGCVATDCVDGFKINTTFPNDITFSGCTSYSNSGCGFFLVAHYHTVTGCISYDNGTGFKIEGDYSIFIGNQVQSSGNDGFQVYGDYNIFDYNVATGGVDGIDIKGGATGNVVGSHNILSGNTNFILDAGTNTRLPTIQLPFIQGTTFLSVDGAAWGWEIDLDTEFAIALGHLPLGLQSVVRWKVWAVSLVAEADAMRLQIAGAGGASDEAYNTEAVAVVDKPSITTNFAVDDVIYWAFTSADDTDIDEMFGGDTIMIKVLHEGAGGADVETDAVFLCVEIEYV